MAHEIHFDETTKTHSFASHKEVAWHGLGQIVTEAMIAEQAIKLANLDYEVDKTSVCAAIPVAKMEGDQMVGGIIYPEFENRFATYRTDTNVPLGQVGTIYEIVQNKDAFGFFDAIIDSGEAIFETAGALGKGERIFVTAKLPDDILVNGDPCNKYIVLTNSHNGTSSIIAGFTNVRVVCANTLQAAMSGLQNKVSIQHRAGAKEKIAEAYKVMNIASKYMSEVEGIFTQMANTPLNDTKLRTYITDVMKNDIKTDNPEDMAKISTQLKNKVDSIFAFALGHETQDTKATRGTVYGAYNAISGYYSHIARFKTQEDKMKCQLFGIGEKKITKGFQKAYELILS